MKLRGLISCCWISVSALVCAKLMPLGPHSPLTQISGLSVSTLTLKPQGMRTLSPRGLLASSHRDMQGMASEWSHSLRIYLGGDATHDAPTVNLPRLYRSFSTSSHCDPREWRRNLGAPVTILSIVLLCCSLCSVHEWVLVFNTKRHFVGGRI